MDNRFNNPFICELEETGCFPDIVDSPPLSDVINNNAKLPSTNSSPKRSKRSSLQKRVVTVPITDVNGSRLKGEGAPPSDSWAWRKYGQKPIKGSPYPRGYYRCSSSKGCPARKQVERSRVDPTMLVITYACEHNHTWPASKNSNNNNNNTLNSTTTLVHESKPEDPTVSPTRPGSVPEPNLNTQFADLGDDSLVTMDDFSWFSDVESTRRTVLDTPICTESSHEGDVAMIFQMREEDESLFGDLGELPECSVVFGREQRIRSCATSIDCGGILKSTGCVSCATRYQNFQNY